jgi:threonine dehydratase
MDCKPAEDHLNGVINASLRIKDSVFRTPLIYSHYLSSITSNLYGEQTRIYLKLESEQLSGSFKPRGAYNKVILYKDCGKEFITASTGFLSFYLMSICLKLEFKNTSFS